MAERLPEEGWIGGVDIGGTNVRVGMVPFGGGPPVAVSSVPTRPRRGAGPVVAEVVAMLRAAAAHVGPANVLGVGIGAPGPLDPARQVVLETPNLGWRDVPLVDMVASGAGLPVVLDNDANCFAFGEWWLGAGRGAERLIGVTLGTGVGGGIVLGGEPYRGASNAAGEVGHMCVDYAGRRCACGSRGCVEAYVSGSAIAARAAEGLADGAESTLTAAVGDPAGIADDAESTLSATVAHPAPITAEAVCEAAADGDQFASSIIDETARLLGVAVSDLIHLLNPDVVVIGGGVAVAGELLFAPMRDEVARRTFRSAARACRIVPARHPATAGLVGAAGICKLALHGRV